MSSLKQYGRYGTVGIELILSMILGYLGGRWLDGKLGTHWITWVGAAVGVYAGFRALFLTARKMQRDIEADERDEAQKAGARPERGVNSATERDTERDLDRRDGP